MSQPAEIRTRDAAQAAAPRWNVLYYDEWVAREGLELLRGNKVENLYTVELKPWSRTGGHAVHIQLAGTGNQNGAYVQEVPPGKALEPQKHLYEELVYVLSGRGATSLWYEEGHKASFEWQAGSLFAIPLNARYQHFNLSGGEPARYVAVTTAPILMNLLRNDEFIFDNESVFPDRFDGSPDFFARPSQTEYYMWDAPWPVNLTNFVADIHGIPFERNARAEGAMGVTYEVGSVGLGCHVLQLPGGILTNVHRHGPGAHVLWLKGEGYTLTWPEGGERVQEFWGPGTMLVPPSWWWHHHAVVSAKPAEHIALKMGSKRFKIDTLNNGAMRSTRNGGSMLLFEDFPPGLMNELKARFVRECEKRGTPVHLEPIYGV